MSHVGSALTRAPHPALAARSAATPRTSPAGAEAFTVATARSTAALGKPVDDDRGAAIRKATGDGEALPPVEPVTMAVLPERSIFMEIPRYKCLLT